MKYDTVIFDFDGTIMDSQEGIATCFQYALDQYGVKDSVEHIKSLIGPPLARTIITEYGFSEEKGREAIKIFQKYSLEKGIYMGHVFDGVVNMLETLKENKLKLAIATNKPESMGNTQIKHFGLDKYFDSVQINNDTQTRGTKADFIRWAVEDCGSSKEKAIMVGDRDNDILGAKEVGLDSIAVLYGYGSKEELEGCSPTYIVKTCDEILKIVL